MRSASRGLPAWRGLAFALAILGGIMFSGASFADDFASAIKSGNEQWDAAFNRGDAAAVAQLYAPDAQVLPPNKTPIQGTAAIQEFFAGLIKGGYTDHEIETLEVRAAGDLGFQTGRWRARGPASESGEQPAVDGLIVTIHEKQKDGTWKIRVHTFN